MLSVLHGLHRKIRKGGGSRKAQGGPECFRFRRLAPSLEVRDQQDLAIVLPNRLELRL